MTPRLKGLLQAHAGEALSTDDQRRLHILFAGVVAGVGPMGLLAAVSVARHADPFASTPPWAWIAIALLFPAFPLALAYVLRARRVLGLRSLALQALVTGNAAAGRFAHVLFLLGSLACVFLLPFASAEAVVHRLALQIAAIIFIVLGLLSDEASHWLKARFFPEAIQTGELLADLECQNVRGIEPMLELVTSRLGEAFRTPAIAFIEKPAGFVSVACAGYALPVTLALATDSAVVRQLRVEAGPLPVQLEDAPDWARSLSLTDRASLSAMKMALLIPLFRDTRLIGILGLAAKPTEEPYAPSELALLQRFAKHTGVAVENSLLFSSLATEVAQRERQRADQEAASRANTAKSDFLARMSHELRTPLNAIIGYSELLQELAQEQRLADFVTDLGKICAASQHLLQLINSILDISKIEAGRVELLVETVSIEALLKEVMDIVQPMVAKNKNTLVFERTGEIGHIQTDITKLRQTIFNLLSNAAKFTQNGTITLGSLRTEGAGMGLVQIWVRDTGIGISEEQAARLFQAFMQADPSISRDFGGSGLGLAISRHFCRIMGGDLTLESSPGQGSTFTIVLPVVAPSTRRSERNLLEDTSSKTLTEEQMSLQLFIPDINRPAPFPYTSAN
jgi:signal transduction histidine kinase